MNNKVYDFYYSYECSKLETIKRFFKNMPFNHAVEHGKSPDHIQWDDLVKVGVGTYNDVKVINHTKSIYKGKNTIHFKVKKLRNTEGYIKILWKFS